MRRSKALMYLALLAAFYLTLLVGALFDRLSLVVIGAVGSFAADYLLRRTRSRSLLTLLSRVGLAMSWRFFYRQVLLLCFLLREPRMSSAALRVVVVAVLLHHLLLAVVETQRSIMRRLRIRRMESRNLQIPAETLPRALPAWLMARSSTIVLLCEGFLTVAVAYTAVTQNYEWVAPGAVLMDVVPIVLALYMYPFVRALRRMPEHAARWAAVQEMLTKLKPLVILYFSGGASGTYQLDMWLQTVEQLGGRALVVVRERSHLSLLRKTTLPVICLPTAVDVMNLEVSDVRVGLYVANVGKNIHLLRVPTMMSAFIGHGDSDKTASFNPYSKVYDEVWVAGEAGRQRYLKAQVGVREEDIVLVGRPQLDSIRTVTERAAGAPFTVLYAPTWEGWTEDSQQTSLIDTGAKIISVLLATPGVRVMFKPHPLTGSVQAAAREASAQITRMLAQAGPQHVVVRNNEVSLYDCFDQSDALVSDISSVVSDYLKSQKPYFVSNNADLPAEEFRELNSAAGAAYLIGSGAQGLAEGLADARTHDSLRGRREEISSYVLGDATVPAIELFRTAVRNLAARAEQQLAAHQATQEAAAGDDDERMEAEIGVASGSILATRDAGGLAAGGRATAMVMELDDVSADNGPVGE